MSNLDVFISYKREERALAQKLIDTLNDAGFTVGSDADIEPNDDFIDAIQTMIDSAKATLVLWTAASVNSRFVKMEARRALKLDQDDEKENVYRGLLLENIDLPMDFSEVNMMDFSKAGLTKGNINKVIDELNQCFTDEDRVSPEEARQRTIDNNKAIEAFYRADQLNEIAGYEAFIAANPKSVLVNLAESRISDLNKVWPNLLRKAFSIGGLVVITGVATVLVTFWVSDNSKKTFVDSEANLLSLKKKDEIIKVLNGRIKVELNKNQSLSSEIEILNSQVTSEKKKYSDLEKIAEERASQIGEFITDNKRLEKSLSDEKSIRSGLEKSQNAITEKFDTAQNNVSRLQDSLSAELENSKTLQNDIASLTDRHDKLAAEHTLLADNKRTLDDQIDTMISKQAELETEKFDTENKLKLLGDALKRHNVLISFDGKPIEDLIGFVRGLDDKLPSGTSNDEWYLKLLIEGPYVPGTVMELQSELIRLKIGRGAIDGNFGDQTNQNLQTALKKFDKSSWTWEENWQGILKLLRKQKITEQLQQRIRPSSTTPSNTPRRQAAPTSGPCASGFTLNGKCVR